MWCYPVSRELNYVTCSLSPRGGGWRLGLGDIEDTMRLAPIRSVYDENFSSIGAIIKKSSWGWGLGVKLYWSKINFGYAKILVLTRSNDTPSFSTIELILRKLSWGVGGWGGWGRTLSPEKDVPLQVVPIFQISAWSVIRQENWCYWGVGGLG